MRARWRQLTVMLLGCCVALGVLSADTAVSAPASPELGIVANVFNRTTDDDGKNVREPVADVEIVVSDSAGAEVARGVTDAEGRFRTPVDAAGPYLVEIDLESLPEGITVDEESGTSKEVQVGGGVVVGGNADVIVNFFVGESTRETQSRLDLLPQALANGVILAAIIAITSIGLSLVYGTTGLSNFAHGELVTVGATLTWMFNQSVGEFGLPLSALLGITGAALLAGSSELGVWRPLRRRSTSLTSMMVVSIGLALALRYLIQLLFGGGDQFYRIATQEPISIGPVELTPRSISIIIVTFLLLTGVALFLLKARFGKAIRAVSDNPDLASATGINTDRVILVVWLLGGALAGVGGVFYGMEFGVSWDMGSILLLLMFAAITLGGLGNPFGAMVGSLVVGIFVELWAWVLTPDLKTVGALIALIAILLARPQGLLGKKERLG